MVVHPAPGNLTGTLVNAVLIRGLPFKDSGQLFMLGPKRQDGRAASLSISELRDWRAQSKTFAGLAGMRVGYAIFPPALAPFAMQVMPAFGNIAGVSAAAAIASSNTAFAAEPRKSVDTSARRGTAPACISGVCSVSGTWRCEATT